jgi:hypothetical protein
MAKRVEPKHFYLNEQHELSRLEREGGGSLPKLGEIDWAPKQRRLSRSLQRVRQQIASSADPLRESRYFLLARPERSVPKLTDNKKKAPSGRFDEAVDYAGKDSRILGRLGLDVLNVTEEGAVVHATPERFERLLAVAPNLSESGRVEQARWAFVADFDAVPPQLRADKDWLATTRSPGTHDSVVELQPLLSSTEAASVIQAISEGLHRRDGEVLLASGTDFSGRVWIRASLVARTIARIVQDFFSIQAVHGPLYSQALVFPQDDDKGIEGALNSSSVAPGRPVVAVVDTGVAKNHVILHAHRRGTFIHPQSQGGFDDHGTFVASRVVFGDVTNPATKSPVPEVAFVDVIVGQGANKVDDLIVVNAIETVAANFPDARVFNLSFGDYTAVDAYQPVQRAQRLQRTEQLDNLVFARDLVVVVAAGNSSVGIVPTPDYPESWRDPSWALGHWAVGFNTLKCGSFVRDWTMIGGLADVPGAPSPFCRVGPGLAGAPAPDFSSHGGNCDGAYRSTAAMRVLGLGLDGKWRGKVGTSHAAPVVSREAAFLLQSLETVCPPDTRPFASTAKALLALTSHREQLPPRFEELASRTLGYGEPSRLLLQAHESSAVFVWQGVLSHKGDTARVVVPIPKEWLTEAEEPLCEMAVAWDTPVNAAVMNIYGCRRVNVSLRPTPDSDAIRGSRGSHPAYPLRVRRYPLAKAVAQGKVTDDLWTVELSYDEMCDYPAAQTFTPEQRVSFAIRLVDRKGGASPQAAVQALETVRTMTRLSAAPVPVQIAVAVKQRT